MNAYIENFLNRIHSSKILSNFEYKVFLKSSLQKWFEKNIFSTFLVFFGLYLAIWNQTIPEISTSGDLYKFKLISIICGISIYSFLLLRLIILGIFEIQISYHYILKNAVTAIILSFTFLMYFEKPFFMMITGEVFCFGICIYTLLESGYLIFSRPYKKEYYFLFPILGGIGFGVLGNFIGTTFYNFEWNSISYYFYAFFIFTLYLLKRKIRIQTEAKASQNSVLILNSETQEIIEQPCSVLEDGTLELIEPLEEKNLLKEDDLKRAEERINGFIREKLYADDSIRLIDLSAYLGVSLHQASFYLNKYKNMGFSDFINQNRMNDAIRLLVEKKNMNLLDIAFECGFNSYTSFHRACKKWTGYSPKGLRKNATQSNGSNYEHFQISINLQKVEILSKNSQSNELNTAVV
ncbi:helix-turn-helix domain-containing protein [Leptospira kirschneri]|uniref:DNA-binding helix-turn-helix protein n=1 Tax=Leptospira kirschneri str. 200802841 TaxID=1193047 RepID=A0A828XRD6_9LEPT|nr:helix-turn-helix domain-containing protein [Leptospira kirschneri]EMO75754.1 DNA-binding helix-turn-helix protein [Leptospira kirschneri str. 200801925]EJO68015.1 DNA-binding helix-turn-helix protein [Leptospira kirschneri serovar Grippotyphosa str. RM52]EKO49712.1 DNA-binding helix-turn-helix protein [Leptospira kirschneri str. 200802841]EKQ85686.1 DNA-binding helix-turn-helix protein [Leptospira kirschneri serovar Grippotyphosa str. Moskva]EKR09466.1 DNA-binding helix-turn-helix protein [